MDFNIPEYPDQCLEVAESCLSSGYSTAEPTPPFESAHFGFHWNQPDNLDSASSDGVHKTLFLSLNGDGVAIGRDCSFYISFKEPIPLSDLTILVTDSTGYRYPIDKRQLPDGFVCTFKPLVPGLFLFTVCYRDLCHIQGSPSHLMISRDYQKQLSRSIVSMDLEIMESFLGTSSDSPCLQPRKPWGICCNTKTEQLLVADREQHEILVYGPDGQFNFKFGKHGDEHGEFFRPTALAYDEVADRILVTDKDNHRVQIFSPDGQFLSTFGLRGKLPGQFLYPWGIAVSRDGTLIAVSDSRNHRIQLFNAAGQYLRHFSMSNGRSRVEIKSSFDFPRGIAFSLTGDSLYVTDFNLHTVFQIDIGFHSYRPIVFPGQLYRPSGLITDDAGNLLICDTKHHSIKIFRPDGQPLGQLNSIGTSPLDLPTDITLMKVGFIAILDQNGRVRIV